MASITSAAIDAPPTADQATESRSPLMEPHPRDRHFDTSHLKQNLKSRTVRSGAITLTAQGIKFFLRLGSTAVLARMLSPADFGLIAMVTVFTSFVELFNDAGLSMATVQREKITHEQVSTLFWINLALSVVVMLSIAALAPAVAWFYHEPRLVAITLALACTMIFGGLAVQHQALLRRNMRFDRLAVVEIGSTAVGIATAILMAYFGCGYWSLVGMVASSAVMTAVLSISLSGWVPGFPRRDSGVRPLLAVGGSLTGGSLMGHFARNSDSFFVGHFQGANALGLYNRSMALLLAPWGQLMLPLHAVVEPALCRVSSTPSQFLKLYQEYLSFAAALTVPTTVLLALNAREIITLALGPSWSDAVEIFVALFPAALVCGIRTAQGWLFTPLGNAHRHLYWGFFSVPTQVTAYFIGIQFGTVGLAMVYSLCQVVLFVIGVEYGIAGTFVRRRDVWCCILPALVGSMVGCAIFIPVSQYSTWCASILLAGSSLLVTAAIQYAFAIPCLWDGAIEWLSVATRQARLTND